jgi:hypothetical protein
MGVETPPKIYYRTNLLGDKNMKTNEIFAIVSNENVAYTGTAGQSAAFASGIHAIRICSSTAAYYKIGGNPTATSSDTYLPADEIEYLIVNPGQKISFLQVSTGGTASISQLSK